MTTGIGRLEIELVANAARLISGMKDAQTQVAGSMKSIEGGVGKLQDAFKGLAALAGVASFGLWIKSAIDAGDEAFNLSQKLGVSVKELGGLQLAFKLAGVEGDAMEKGLVKLSVQISSNGKALQSLGVDARGANGTLRSTTDVLKDVADRFAGMDDGARKTAIAVQLFGKSGAAMIPLLNEGSAGLREMDEMARKLGLTMSDETARSSDQLNDTLDLLKMAVQGVARQAVAEVLPSLTNMAAGLLKASTEGDTLKTAAQLLATVLKTLFTAVMGVAEGLNTLAIGASATWRAFLAATDGEFSKAADIIKQAGTDIASGWSKTSEIVQKAWSNTADTSMVQGARVIGIARQMGEAQTEQGKAADAATKAAAKQAEEYDKLTASLDKQLVTVTAEIGARGKLNEAQKLEIDIRARLNDGTLKLTEAQRAEVEAKLDAVKAAMADRDAQKAADEARRKLSESIGKQNEDLVKQIEAQQKANEESGLTTQQIARLEIQRLRDAAATAQQNAQLRIQSGINDEVTKEYQQQAENLRKLADEKEKGVHVEAAQQARDAWAETTKSIYDGLTDALMRAFESGKGFMDAFKSTLKNAFKTLVLEPTIRAVMGPVAGAVGSLFGGAANAATGGAGGGLGILGQIGGLGTLGGVFGAGITGGLASYLGGASAVGGLMSGGFSALGSSVAAGSLSGIAASLGTLAGTLGPIALGIGLLVKGFSRGPKQTTETGIEGMIGGGEVDARQYSNWIKKGGWFRSDKRGVDYSALGADTAAALDQTARAVYDQSRLFAEAVGLSGDALSKVQTQIRVKLGQDEEANKAAIEAAFAAYREDLATSLGESLAPFQKAGETLADTLERLAQLATFSNDINQLGGVFSTIASLSVSAREELIGFAGGMEALLQKASSFVSSYYSQDEQFGLQARQIQKALESLGITAALSSRDDFRRLVESQDVSTSEGRKTFAALLDIAQAFAPVGQFLEQNKKSLDELAKAAPQVKVLESILEDAETQTEWAEKQAAATDRVYDGIVDLGDIFANAMAGNSAAIEALRASIEAGLAQVASNTNATNKLLDSWDNNGSMATTAVP
jgi:hypothetical protein